jgi:hypothetical protein
VTPLSDTRDVTLLAELLTGKTIAAAAEAAGYTERTAQRRLADDGFRAQLDAACREVFELSKAQAARGRQQAFETLLRIAADVAASDAAQVNAAKALLEASERSQQATDLAARVRVLEDRERRRRAAA